MMRENQRGLRGKSVAPLRRVALGASLCFALGTVSFLSTPLTPSAEAQTAAKTIEGKVLNGSGAPLPGSIVYLQDQKTNVVKTYIATADGSYRFSQLPANTDYRIWAKYKDERSSDRLISSFDTKLTVTHDFKIGK